MDRQELHRQLEQLHRELRQVKSPDMSERELLRQLADDVKNLLDREDNQSQHYSGLSERLTEAVAQLEASHPRTTMLMRHVIDQLAYMGI